MMTSTATELPFAPAFSYDDAEEADWSPDTHKRQRQNPHPLHDNGEKGQY